MYIDRVPNRNSPPTILLRRCWRDGKKIRKVTLANMTHWPKSLVDTIEHALKGQKLVPVDQVFAIERSLPHGHVEAVLGMIRKLGLDNIIATKQSREKSIIVALIAERLIEPASKLATTRLWKESTLARQVGVEDVRVEEVYQALRWLLNRQERIEKKLAKRHLTPGAFVLYDLTSSYFEGRTCPLARHGYSRDHRGDRLQIVYGVMSDEEGRPVATQVYSGETADPCAVGDQVDKLRERFGLERAVLVGDRGMLTQTRIDAIKKHPQLGWISALRSGAIKDLVCSGDIQCSLFDERNLAEIISPDFPGERLIVCYNPLLAQDRGHTRDGLLAATEKGLEKIVAEVKRRKKTPLRASQIGMKVAKVFGKYKMKKHINIAIEDGRFEWSRNQPSIAQEQALDGIYVVRTSEPKVRLSAEDTVRAYKNLSQVERIFRTLKGVDLRVRPIFHHLEETVRAHVFLCVLTYYVEWHMRKALAPLLFDDEELDVDRKRRDPVAPAQPSKSASAKKASRLSPDGFEIQSFATLLKHLGTQCVNLCRLRLPDQNGGDEPVKDKGEFDRMEMVTDPTPLQSRAFELLRMYPESGN
jgi:hypothetical protein